MCAGPWYSAAEELQRNAVPPADSAGKPHLGCENCGGRELCIDIRPDMWEENWNFINLQNELESSRVIVWKALGYFCYLDGLC